MLIAGFLNFRFQRVLGVNHSLWLFTQQLSSPWCTEVFAAHQSSVASSTGRSQTNTPALPRPRWYGLFNRRSPDASLSLYLGAELKYFCCLKSIWFAWNASRLAGDENEDLRGVCHSLNAAISPPAICLPDIAALNHESFTRHSLLVGNLCVYLGSGKIALKCYCMRCPHAMKTN